MMSTSVLVSFLSSSLQSRVILANFAFSICGEAAEAASLLPKEQNERNTSPNVGEAAAMAICSNKLQHGSYNKHVDAATLCTAISHRHVTSHVDTNMQYSLVITIHVGPNKYIPTNVPLKCQRNALRPVHLPGIVIAAYIVVTDISENQLGFFSVRIIYNNSRTKF
jgi:hypothetical protein